MIRWMVQLGNRTLSSSQPPYLPSELSLIPARYSWNAIGGPDEAEINVFGPEAGRGGATIWEALQWLRCPITIWTEYDLAVWWGYVDSVEIKYGALTVGVSLEHMANNVAVSYNYCEVGYDVVGEAETTAYATDAESIAEYGTKDLIVTLQAASADMAENARDATLAARKYPVPIVSVSGMANTSAVLRCKGWWHTLDWRYYTLDDYDDVATTTQISTIVGSAGQFISSTEIDDASGITMNEYRDGKSTALQVIEPLLASGTTNHKRLLATVSQGRVLRVYEEPAANAATDYHVTPLGLIYQGQQEVQRSTCPVAAWVRLRDVPPWLLDTGAIGAATPFFIERSEYNVSSGSLTIEPKDVPSPWTFFEIETG